MTDIKKKILVVDDDDSLNTILVDKLNISGFEAKGAVDGEDGLAKALANHPDVILLDLVMPKMNGMEMLKKLRTDEWGKTAKVVILTLLDKVDYVAEAMEYKVSGYIVKTDYSLEGIVKKIEEVV